MNSSRGLRRWIIEVRSSPVQASVGLGVGIILGVISQYLTRFRADKHSVFDQLDPALQQQRIVATLIVVAIFVWFLWTYKITRKLGETFVFSLLTGFAIFALIWVLRAAI